MSGGRTRTWLLREPSPGAGALLFCFPYLGTGASMFHRWPRMIGDTEVCPVQLPGRENRLREPAIGSYEDLADALTAELVAHLNRPVAFFAHCSSVFMAFQTALTLTATTGVRLRRLFVSSMVPPDQTPFGTILQVDRQGMTEVVADLMRARGAQVPPELLDMAVEVMARDVELYRCYRPPADVRLPCPATVIAWRDDTDVTPERTRGWSAYGEVRQVLLTGGHWSFLDAPDGLLEAIRHDLQQPGIVERTHG